MALAAPLVGCTDPRVATPVVGDPSRGREAIDFAERTLGVLLLPWQRTLIDRSCRTDERGRWIARSVLALVGRQNGKSFALACRVLAGIMLWDERLVLGCAQSRDIALAQFRTVLELAEDAGLGIKKVHKTTGREEIEFDVDGHHVGRYKIVSATPGGARGLSADAILLDELREHRNFDAFAAIEKTRRARPSSQLLCISTSGDVGSVVLDRLTDQGRTAVAAGSSSPLAFMEWSADPDLPAADPRGWAQANPALGMTLDPDVIAAELASDPPEIFEMEVLCRTVAVARPWLPSGTWEACTDAEATVPDDAVGQLTFAIDAAPDLTHVSICVAWPRPDGATHVEAVSAFDGPTATTLAQSRLLELVARWKPKSLAVVAKGPAEAVAGRVATGTGVDLVAVGAADLDRASRAFLEAVTARRLVHPPDALLGSHVGSAQAGAPGLFTLRSTAAPIDAAVAAVIATWCAERAPATPKFAWSAY